MLCDPTVLLLDMYLHKSVMSIKAIHSDVYSSTIHNDPKLLLLLFSCSVVSVSLRPQDCSTPGFPFLHHLPEFAQTHVHQVSDAIQPSHPLLSPSSPAFNLSQHQGLFK